ncbi:Uma2 family endonuclease [Pleurocapsales cyanobacterium LEGE 10410]|nr:Uma2 family endonuclease [Pleurocapsales cyanobacterium LEGE 10410]
MATLAKWSVQDYHLMLESGVLNSRSVELIEGEIVEVSPEEPLHRFTNDSIAEYLRGLFRGKAKVFEAHSITLANSPHSRASEPEPDIAVVSLPNTNYLTRHPYPNDIYWLIEISQTTLEEDLGKKKQVYAKAMISEYWVVDLKNTEIIVFRNPSGNDYNSKFTIDSGTIQPIAFPDIEIKIAKLLTSN